MKKQDRPDIIAEADDFFGSANFAEYTVDKRIEGSYKRARATAIFCYILFSVLLIGTLCAIFVWMVALAPLFIWMAVYFTWPRFCISYYYVIKEAHFSAQICHGKKKTELYRFRISECETIAPYTQEQRAKNADALERAEIIDIRPSDDCDDAYFALHGDKAVLFKITKPALKALSYYSNKVHKI